MQIAASSDGMVSSAAAGSRLPGRVICGGIAAYWYLIGSVMKLTTPTDRARALVDLHDAVGEAQDIGALKDSVQGLIEVMWAEIDAGVPGDLREVAGIATRPGHWTER